MGGEEHLVAVIAAAFEDHPILELALQPDAAAASRSMTMRSSKHAAQAQEESTVSASASASATWEGVGSASSFERCWTRAASDLRGGRRWRATARSDLGRGQREHG